MNSLPQHWKKEKRMIGYQFIQKYATSFSIKIICKMLNISRAAYYNWIKNFNKNITNEYEPLLTKYVKKIFENSKQNYGRKRIKIALIKENIDISEFKISKIMKINGFVASKSGKPKSNAFKHKKQTVGKFPNLLKGLSIIKKEQVLVTDITDISIANHKLGAWLCTFCNPYNGMIMGYAYAHHQKTVMIKRAFNQAIKNSRPFKNENPLIIHSDNGSQFLSTKFQTYVKKFNINWSNSRTYCSTDNAFAETWFSSMKTEFLKRKKWKNYQELFNELKQYIQWYNDERILTRLRMSPKIFNETSLMT